MNIYLYINNIYIYMYIYVCIYSSTQPPRARASARPG